MASSDQGTSSGSQYDVFLNFRGADTRYVFTDHLYHSLIDAGIYVFRDNEELHVGERIDGSLQRAIDNCEIYIPIFSQNYASSKWCLQELMQIVTSTLTSNGMKKILPIFFMVKPDDVKLKTPLYREAILNLKGERKLSTEQVHACREALQYVGAIKGWEVPKFSGLGEIIRLVVKEVVERLKTKHRSMTEHLVGVDDRVAKVSELLDIDSGGVRLIIIHGMGGIGKTTLAKVVFNQLSSHFGKCCCFLEDVREKSSRTNGLLELQKKLLSEISHPVGTKGIDENDYGMKRTGEILRNKKVLIVLDNVDSREQVEKLVGETTLYLGSRILITSRNKDVLQTYKPKYQILEYQMEVMSFDHALQLFNKHASPRDSPSDDYNDLSKEIVYASGGLPLTLKVIGSLLYREAQEQWKMTLDKLRQAPQEEVVYKLRISYDALTFEQQQIFLDIACFFIGEDKTNALYMWKDCGFYPISGIEILERMSLVKVMENNKFWMHDQLRDFGREIVRQENPINPGQQSRIWNREEVLDAITTTEMKKTVQALYLDTNPLSSHNVIVQSKEIRRFEYLRFLNLTGGTFDGNLANCLTNLRWISWNYTPQICKWTNMYLPNVVVLEFSDVGSLNDSKLQNLIEMARKLKVLSLKSCRSISKTPNFSGCPNIERLTFEDCSDLKEIDCSIGELKHLINLKIDKCFCLEDLPKEIGDLVNLQHFFVQRCKVKKLPNSIWKLKSLCELHFSNDSSALVPTELWELPSAIGMLHNLEVLQVNSLHLKGQLPSSIGSLPYLRILNLSNTRVSEVPKTLSMLPCLQRLELSACHNIQKLPTLPTSLTHLRVSSASLQAIPDLSKLANLVELDLTTVELEEPNSISMS